MTQHHTTQAGETPRSAPPSVGQVICDYCQWPMALPQHCADQGEVIGLLVCTACVEDELQARVAQ